MTQENLSTSYLGECMTHTVTIASQNYSFYIEEKAETLDVRVSHLARGAVFDFSMPKPAEGSLKNHALREAYFQLGIDYHEKNAPLQASLWFKVAAYKGHINAAFLAGIEAVQDGNLDEAASFFGIAGSKPEAAFMLALQFIKGDGVPQSDQSAYTWMRRAAEGDYAPAQRELGAYISKGVGIPSDDTESAEWYKKAAKSGDREGQGRLGTRYHNGKGVPQSYAKAFKWFSRAAHQGLASTEYLVAD